MKIDPATFVTQGMRLAGLPAPLDAAVLPAKPGETPAAGGSGFLSAFENAVTSVDARTRAADEQMAAVDAGQSDDLVGAMLASQEASLSFSLLMQVRNKVMVAVDDLIKLQV
jgi:flagellar hook-basal body complex protein FliE